MVKIDVEELKARIDCAYDVESVVDILGLSVLDILNAFEERVLMKADEFDLDNDYMEEDE